MGPKALDLAKRRYSTVHFYLLGSDLKDLSHPYLIIGWEDEVLGSGGIWGRVQGVGSDHWGTSSLPSLGLHPFAVRTRAKRAF